MTTKATSLAALIYVSETYNMNSIPTVDRGVRFPPGLQNETASTYVVTNLYIELWCFNLPPIGGSLSARLSNPVSS